MMVALKNVENFLNVPDVNYQARFLTVCPLAPKALKEKKVLKNGKSKNVYQTEFVKVMGNTELILVGREKYGIPHGRDILVILYLIREALIQNNSGIIVTKTPLRDYMDLFEIDKSKKGYKEAKTRFLRIRYSHFYWDEKGKNEDTRQKSEDYRIIKRWSVAFDKRETDQKYDNYIELDSDFWNYIKKRKIPYDIKLVRKLKDKTIALNLYLFLVYRTYQIWTQSPKKEVFIPFYGENGLMNQLSANFQRKRDFKAKLINKWLPQIKWEWENCPCIIEKIQEKKGKKQYKDGITIHIESAAQLHISPHWPKRIRQAREEAKKEPPEIQELKEAENDLNEVNMELEKMRNYLKTEDVVELFRRFLQVTQLQNQKEELENRIKEQKTTVKKG